MTVVSEHQFQLDFEPGLTRQFPHFMDCVAAVILGYRGGAQAVAGACDVSPSTISRWCNWRNEDDPRHMPMKHLATIIATTGDHRPIYWLIESFLEDEDTKNRRAMNELRTLVPRLHELLERAG